jgi:hypothetical protein
VGRQGAAARTIHHSKHKERHRSSRLKLR